MKLIHNKFVGVFSAGCQRDSVPIELLTLISMLVDGVGIDNEGFSQEALTISQLIMYNFKNKKVCQGERGRRQKCYETPLPTYISLKMYATVRSKSLIDSLFSLGICLPYKRILDITKEIAEKELKKYELNGCFIPHNTILNIPTIIAKDNIDLNARSTIVKSHFHGISMSVLQIPSRFNPGVIQEHNLDECTRTPHHSKKIPKLPSQYTEFKELPYYDKSPLYSPASGFNTEHDVSTEELDMARQEEIQWLEIISNATTVEVSSSWSKQHSSFNRKEVEERGGRNRYKSYFTINK